MEERSTDPVAVEAKPVPTDLLLDPPFPYGEDLLQFIWEAGLYDATELRTTDGDRLEVIEAGRIQPNAGPDLNGAMVRIGGQTWAGNVEVHLRTSDWNLHGHQHDPAYNNVVLHTVYLHDGEARTTDGRCPPTVELRGRIKEHNLHLHQQLMESRAAVPCAPGLHRVEAARMNLWLERLLVERLERKTAAVDELFRKTGNDPSATLHHLLLTALGTRANAEPFGMLAFALPLKLLLKYGDDPLRTEALLFGQAGLLNGRFADEHPRRLQQEYQWLATVHQLRPVPVAAWNFGRLRPPNFPTLRLAQWSAVLSRHPDVLHELTMHDDVAPVRALLEVEAGAYWHHRYRFDQPSAPRAKRLGRSTADGLVINAVVPFLFAMGRIRGHQPWMDRALRLMEQLPPEANHISRLWQSIGVKAESAGQSQALIELKNRWCAEKRCLECAIGVRLHRVG